MQLFAVAAAVRMVYYSAFARVYVCVCGICVHLVEWRVEINENGSYCGQRGRNMRYLKQVRI